jgi:diguanylate cyclase (GGDEF)-like protein/PAS domain S-box-containing protein
LVDSLFHRQLFDSLNDGAIYLDAHGKILRWNRAMETISGRTASSVLHCNWSPNLIGLLNEDETPVTQDTCPLSHSLKFNSKHSASLCLRHPSGETIQIEMSSIPLFSSAQSLAGFVVLIHDDSKENDLARKVETLHAIATQDPLTKVANRSELNRRLEELVASYNSAGMPSAVIMCDIDFFKRINDTYSHQAGDEALITFSALLREFARKDDLVARYGGEEFVVLCQGCDIGSATARAEELRKKIERTPVPAIGGKSMTSSFGVTEFQPGDDADTLIARADRAMMTAKETGRNRVVQMGAGSSWNPTAVAAAAKAEVEAKRSSWLNWFTGTSESIESREFLSAVPIEVAIQKLEGFVNDHNAELLSNSDNEISIRVIGGQGRRGEHRIAMLMNVKVLNVQVCTTGRSKVYQNRTKFSVTIHPVKSRDRRQSVIEGQARQLILSFQAYVVGQEIDESLKASIILPR